MKKDSEASASSQSNYNNRSTNGQVTSTKSQNATANVPECDDAERCKKMKRIKSVRIPVQCTNGMKFDEPYVYMSLVLYRN